MPQGQRITRGITRRKQSESDAASSHLPRNTLRGAGLTRLLDEYKDAARSPGHLQTLADSHGLDIGTATRLVQFVNTPTVEPTGAREVVNKDSQTVYTYPVSPCLVSP